MLAKVIKKLSEDAKGHIPYRESKLTLLLKNSLGGNSMTRFVCSIAPSKQAKDQTISTLRFAERAKKVEVKARVNEVIDDHDLVVRLKHRIAELENSVGIPEP